MIFYSNTLLSPTVAYLLVHLKGKLRVELFTKLFLDFVDSTDGAIKDSIQGCWKGSDNLMEMIPSKIYRSFRLLSQKAVALENITL